MATIIKIFLEDGTSKSVNAAGKTVGEVNEMVRKKVAAMNADADTSRLKVHISLNSGETVRALRDHEYPADILSSWPKETINETNKFVFKAPPPGEEKTPQEIFQESQAQSQSQPNSNPQANPRPSRMFPPGAVAMPGAVNLFGAGGPTRTTLRKVDRGAPPPTRAKPPAMRSTPVAARTTSAAGSSSGEDKHANHIRRITAWANHHLQPKGVQITNLIEDCRQGVLFAQLLETLTEAKPPKQTVLAVPNPQSLEGRQQNVQNCLKTLDSLGAKPPTITADDFENKNTQAVLQCMLLLIKKFQDVTRKSIQLKQSTASTPAAQRPPARAQRPPGGGMRPPGAARRPGPAGGAPRRVGVPPGRRGAPPGAARRGPARGGPQVRRGPPPAGGRAPVGRGPTPGRRGPRGPPAGRSMTNIGAPPTDSGPTSPRPEVPQRVDYTAKINDLEAKKKAAAADEDYDLAKQLKLQVEDLKSKQASQDADIAAAQQAVAKWEAAEKARQEQLARARQEYEAKKRAAAEAAKQKAAAEAQRRAEEESRRKAAEADARRKAAEEDARRKAAEEDARRRQEEAKRKAEAEAKRKAEEEARRKAQEEEAKRKAEEEAKAAEEFNYDELTDYMTDLRSSDLGEGGQEGYEYTENYDEGGYEEYAEGEYYEEGGATEEYYEPEPPATDTAVDTSLVQEKKETIASGGEEQLFDQFDELEGYLAELQGELSFD